MAISSTAGEHDYEMCWADLRHLLSRLSHHERQWIIQETQDALLSMDAIVINLYTDIRVMKTGTVKDVVGDIAYLHKAITIAEELLEIAPETLKEKVEVLEEIRRALYHSDGGEGSTSYCVSTFWHLRNLLPAPIDFDENKGREVQLVRNLQELVNRFEALGRKLRESRKQEIPDPDESDGEYHSLNSEPQDSDREEAIEEMYYSAKFEL